MTTSTTAGSVRQLPAGPWQATIPLGFGRGARKQRKNFATKRDALAWLQAAQIGKEALGATAAKTVRQAFGLYVAAKRIKPGTARTFASAFAQVEAAGMADIRLRDFRPSMLDTFATFATKAVAPSTARMYVTKLVAVLRFARADGALGFDPKSPPIKVVRTKKASLTSAQVKALYDAAPEFFRPMIVLQAFAGMRISEAAAITAADVHDGVISVTKQIADVGGFVPTKNLKVRDVPVPHAVVDMLPLAGKLPGAYLSTNAYGEALKPSTAGDWFRDTAAAAGLVGVTSHELRKFYVSTNLGAGVNPANVAAQIGDTVKVMLETYALVQAPDADLSREAMSEALAQAFAA